MVRFIVLVAVAIAVFWCFNNVNFSNIIDNAKTSIQNAITVKAVNGKHAIDYEQEQAAIYTDY